MSTAAATIHRRIGLRACLAVSFVGTVLLGGWFLIGPLVGPTAVRGYYRPVLHIFTYGYSHPITLLFIPYALALIAWWRGERVAVKWLLGGAIVLHAMLLFAPPPQSQDIQQYLFYGRMQLLHIGAPLAHAGNPYVIQPAVGFHDAWYSWIRWPTQTTVYGPVWSLISYGVAGVAGSSHTAGFLTMKLVIFGFDLGLFAMILSAAKDRPDAASREAAAGFGLLAYAWNPLVLISVPLGGLVDVTLAAGLVGAYLARRRGHPWLTTVLLSLVTLVKVYAGIGLLLHLVLLARERGWRRALPHLALAVAIAAVLFAPYWAGLQTFRGLFHIATLSNHSLAGAVQRLLEPVVGAIGAKAPHQVAGAIVRWAGLALLAASVVWAVLRTRTERELWHGVLVVLVVYSLATPWFFYWYLVAPIAVVAVLPRDRLTAPILTASGTLFINLAFPPWLFAQALTAALRYVPPIGVFVWEGRRERRTTALPPADPDDGQPIDSALDGAVRVPAAAAGDLPRA